MKKLLLFFSFLLMTVAIMAQSSPFISYQAVVRDGQNRLVTNQAITVTIQVLDASDNVQYNETDDVTSNANGLISLIVGDNDPTHFSTINWEGAKFKTTVKVVSTSYEVTSITPVTAAPLALHAIYASDVNPAGSTVQAIYNKIQGDSLILADRIQNDSLVLANRIQNDSLTLADRIQNDSLVLANRIQNDSLILANKIKSDSTALHNALIDTANNIRNSIGDGTLSITYGTNTPVTFTANQHTNSSITIPEPTSANDATITIKKNGVEVNHFTLNQSMDQDIDIIVPTKVTDLEDNANYVTKTILNDTLNQYYTKTETYTQAEVNALLGTTNAGVNTLRDSVKTNITNIANLQDRVNTFNTHVCDSVMACAGIQTMQNNISTNASNIATNASAITELQTKAHNDSLTLANRIQNDSLTLVNRIKSDSTVLHNALIDTAANIRGALVDSANAIRNSIGNGTLTITYGTETPVTFTANQNTNSSIAIPAPTSANDAEITITSSTATITNGSFTLNQSGNQNIGIEVPTKLSEMVNDGGHYAKRDSVNVFTEANDFTNKITVPSKFDIHNPTPCTQDAVNICDLVAVFDSLMRRIDKLEQELENLQPSLTVTASDPTVTVCSGTSKAVTYTATFHNCSSSDYTILWKVNGTDSANVTGQTLTLNAETAGDHKVVCIATRSDNTSVKDSVTTTVVIDMNVPSFTATTNALNVSLSNIVNTDMLQWDTDSLPVVFDASSTTAEHIYSVADTITITATSTTGCTFVMGLRLQPIAPTVTTDSIPTSTIAANTAKAYGTVTSDGGKANTRRGMVYSTTASTEVALVLDASGVDSVKATGTGKGSYSCDLTKLVPCTQYYVRAYAINEVDTAYGEVKNFTTLPFTCGSTLTDIDGNEYATLLLGSQCWMKQNLRTTRYADGETIILDDNTGTNLPRRYAPGSETESVLNAYGYLYNWAAATRSTSSSANPSGVQGVCPNGWHMPSDAEWTQLTSFVSSDPDNVCGNDPTSIIKSMVSQERWGDFCDPNITSPVCQVCDNLSTNNRTGFSVLPAGTWENGPGRGYSNNGHTIFCTATAYETISEWVREFYPEHTFVERTAVDRQSAFSVRCVLDCSTGHTYLPTVSAVTLSATGATISMTSNVLSDGGATVTERGVCWSTSQNPTTSSDHTADSGTGTGAFTVSGSLTPGNTYYVRAYATNSEGTAYGAEVTYVAPMPTLPPTVNTGSKFIALMEGFEDLATLSEWETIDNDGDGKNWSIGSDPHNGSRCMLSRSWNSSALSPDNYLITPDITLPSGITPVLTFWHKGSGDPSFSDEHFLVRVGDAGASTVSDFTAPAVLEANSSDTYTKTDDINLSSFAGQTIRLAFVHNDTDKEYLCIDDIVVGVAGADVDMVSDVTATTAICGGYVADDGGATVTARGVCWSTSQNPTVSDSHTTDDTGTGSFTSNLTGLSANTTYYVRAYATNSEGTTYGNQLSFKTLNRSLDITSDKAATIKMCGASSQTVTYTATPSYGNPSDYTYSWSCSGGTISGTPTSNTATITYTSAASYTVSCTATHNIESFDVSKTASTTIQSGGKAYPLAMCSENLTIQSKETNWNNVGWVSTISWGDGSSTTNISSNNSYSHTYTSPGIYTVTIIPASGEDCEVTRTFAMGDIVPHPCTVTNAHTNTSTYTSSSGGLETVNSDGKITTVADNDGNTYKVVEIGSQCWMAENLRTTKKPDGTSIDGRYDPVGGVSANPYGYFYDWTAVMNGASASNANPSNVRGICPLGWHVPSDDEWTEMESEVNGSNLSGIAQNSSRGTHAAKLASGCDWKTDQAINCYTGTQKLTPGDYYNVERNSSGFEALTTGWYNAPAQYTISARFWTSSTDGTGTSIYLYRHIGYNQKYVSRDKAEASNGYSLRCVRD